MVPEPARPRTGRNPAPAAGRLVTVEGIDGSGKSTLAREIAAALAKGGHAVETTCEPTKTWLGEAVRRALSSDEPPIVDALLFMADHAAHVARVSDLLDRGITVVSDRWSDSTFAYQGAALEGVVPEPLKWLRAAEAPFDRTPDVTVLLDLPVQAAIERLAGRSALEKFEDAAFLARVRANYQKLARDEPERFELVDATGPVADVAAAAVAAVQRRLAR